jgi:hypothetical protein
MAMQAAKRERSIVRLFKNASSEELAGRAGLDCEAVIFKFPDDTEEEVDLAEFFGGHLPPPCVGRAAAAFGLNTSIGNAGNTAKEEDGSKASPETQIEAVKTRIEVLRQGKWASDAIGGGARPSLLLAAIKEYREANKAPTDDEKMAEIRQKLRDDEELAKQWSKLPPIVAILDRMRAERNQANAKGDAKELLHL